MDKSDRARCCGRTVPEAGLLVAFLLVTASLAGCAGGSDRSQAPAASAFAEGVQVQPPPNGHAAAILYCLD